MEDREFAEELILRLNQLCEDKEAKDLVETMIETRHEVSELMENHPVIEVEDGKVGLLELLNGLAGNNPAGHYGNYSYISMKDKGVMFPEGLHEFVLSEHYVNEKEPASEV